MNEPIVKVKGKKYFVSNISVVLKLNSGPLIYLRLSEKLDGTESKLSNEETLKQEFLEHIYIEEEGSFEWAGTTINFILVGYNSSDTSTFELVGLVVKKDLTVWFQTNTFKANKQDYLLYQKNKDKNTWPFFDQVLGKKFAKPNENFVQRINFLFPGNACIWRSKDSDNFRFLNQAIAFANRHLPEVQGWCAFDDANKPLRLILFEKEKQDPTIPKLDQTWTPLSYPFLPNRYSWNQLFDSSCTLSRELSLITGQEIALIKQLVSDGLNGENTRKGQNFQAENSIRLLFAPGTVTIANKNIFCHAVTYEFKLPGFGEELPSITMKVELNYPHRARDNEISSLRLFGDFQKWYTTTDEETGVEIAPPNTDNWGVLDENSQKLKSGNNAVLYTQILSPTYSDKQYSGIYIKHEKNDEMIIDIQPCGVPLVLGSVQKYRQELEAANITLCGQKLAISISPHNQKLANAEAIILDDAEIKLNHGKTISGQAQRSVNFLSKSIELGSSKIKINSAQTRINSLVNISTPAPQLPKPNPAASRQLLMKTLDGKTKPLQITPDTKISDIKKELGYESADVYLTHQGKKLEDQLTMADYPNIQKDSTLEVRARIRGGMDPITEASNSSPSNDADQVVTEGNNEAASVPEAFKRDPLSSVAYIKSRQELEELLKSYGFDTGNQENLDLIKNFWDKLPQDRLKYNTAPQIIESLTPRKQRSEKKNETIRKVKENNARLAPDVSPNSGTTLERADTRNRDEIEQDGGLHGRGGSMSVEHARSWAAEWEKNRSVSGMTGYKNGSHKPDHQLTKCHT